MGIRKNKNLGSVGGKELKQLDYLSSLAERVLLNKEGR